MHRVRSAPDVTSATFTTSAIAPSSSCSSSVATTTTSATPTAYSVAYRRRRPYLPPRGGRHRYTDRGCSSNSSSIPRTSSCPSFVAGGKEKTDTERVAALLSLAVHASCLVQAIGCNDRVHFEESGMFLPSSLSSECFTSSEAAESRKFCVAAPPTDDDAARSRDPKHMTTGIVRRLRCRREDNENENGEDDGGGEKKDEGSCCFFDTEGREKQKAKKSRATQATDRTVQYPT